MEIGTPVMILVDRHTTERLKKIFIPKGTVGTVCEIHDGWALVEIWGGNAPEGVEGVFGFNFSEIKEIVDN